MLCLSYCLYSLFNKIKIRAEQILPESEGGLGEREGDRGRNGPKNVCTYE
jgi:hypothetical protein